jgi:putative Mg2+ transporter-C (MgtC) family protein
MDDFETIKRLCLSALLGGALGLEREWNQKSAGLRTNILITMGATLFTLMSIDLARSSGGDATRIAAQIVTGIGFLGAGAIMRTGGSIRGLTTAAMIWVNAAVGVAVGGGEYHLALIATGVTLLVLLALYPLEGVIDRMRHKQPPDATSGESSEGDGGEP